MTCKRLPPRGPGIYYIIAVPHPRDDLRATHRHANPMPAVTAADVARELDRRQGARPRDLRDVALDYLALVATMPEGHS